MINTQSTMKTKSELLKQILDLKMKRATDATKTEIQKLQQTLDEFTHREKKETK